MKAIDCTLKTGRFGTSTCLDGMLKGRFGTDMKTGRKGLVVDVINRDGDEVSSVGIIISDDELLDKTEDGHTVLAFDVVEARKLANALLRVAELAEVADN